MTSIVCMDTNYLTCGKGNAAFLLCPNNILEIKHFALSFSSYDKKVHVFYVISFLIPFPLKLFKHICVPVLYLSLSSSFSFLK